VNDYLEPRLADLNRQHLADRTPWLLVQPSGIFRWSGRCSARARAPAGVRSPSAWFATARSRASSIAAWRSSTPRASRASPLARDPFGPGPIALAAVEIAKAIATDFRTDLMDHIVSLDLPGSTVARHYVAHRPQCPACGRKSCAIPSARPCRSSSPPAASWS
jgi:ribosomal protein S12 methylthiotransferase accessory factor